MSNLAMRIHKGEPKKEIPEFRAGDKVRLSLKIREKGAGEKKERIQLFEGRVIARGGSGISQTFTVRKIAPGGVGVERTLPINSPIIDKIKVLEKTKVRRAKLYYLKGSGKDLKRL